MDASYSAVYARLYRFHWWWRVRESLILRRVAEILGPSSEPASILDVGCGAGLLFDELRRYGDVSGVEADLVAIEHSGRWQSRIHHGELDATYAPSRRFDLILLLDVIEHVDDPVALLREAGKRLRDGRSHVLVTVPAFEWLWTSHDNINQHLRRYTDWQLRDDLNSAGLRVVDSRYLFQSLIIPKLLVRLKETLLPSTRAVPTVPSHYINAFLQGWYFVENAVAGWMPFGTSIMALATKQELAPPTDEERSAATSNQPMLDGPRAPIV